MEATASLKATPAANAKNNNVSPKKKVHRTVGNDVFGMAGGFHKAIVGPETSGEEENGLGCPSRVVSKDADQIGSRQCGGARK